jgi:hypothetical protein
MPVTLFFANGSIQEFPTATMARNHDGTLQLVRYNGATREVEPLETFLATEVAVAQVYEDGVLRAVVIGDAVREG